MHLAFGYDYRRVLEEVEEPGPVNILTALTHSLQDSILDFNWSIISKSINFEIMN